MPEKWTIGVKKPSTISDWKKLIQDFRDQFPYDPLTSMIVETFANAIDANATRIDIEVERKNVYRIMDNGSGMTQSDFKEYHNIASLTKRRGETIGFAGVGAKIFLDRAKSITTETKSKSFKGATHWAFFGKSLLWEPIVPPNKVKSKTGTDVVVNLTNIEDVNKLTPQFVKEVLQEQYNAILAGYYKVQNVTINGKEIKPWKIPPSQVEHKKDLNFKYGKHRVKGFIMKTSKTLPEKYQGPVIVVYGKTVRQEWFRQYPLRSDTFYGLILADYLIEILRTSKSDFERTSMLWKKFHSKIGLILSRWLDEIGAKPSTQVKSTDMERMSREIEKSINKVLKMPQFASLANTLFQNIIQRNIAIKSKLGTLAGAETDGMQKIKGTIGNQGNGGGVSTFGDQEGKGAMEVDSGSTPVERIQRRVRGLFKIGFDEKPDNVQEGWIDPGQRAVTVNTGHPAWKIADGLTLQARDERVRVYHIVRTVFSTLIDESGLESPKETLAKLFSSWYNSCIKG
jgi:hypothetical protein